MDSVRPSTSSSSTISSRYRQTTPVDTIEHASFVIRALRSTSHSQRAFKRSAQSEDHIVENIENLSKIIEFTGKDFSTVKELERRIATHYVSEPQTIPSAMTVTTMMHSSDDFDACIDLDSSEDDENKDNIHKKVVPPSHVPSRREISGSGGKPVYNIFDSSSDSGVKAEDETYTQVKIGPVTTSGPTGGGGVGGGGYRSKHISGPKNESISGPNADHGPRMKGPISRKNSSTAGLCKQQPAQRRDSGHEDGTLGLENGDDDDFGCDETDDVGLAGSGGGGRGRGGGSAVITTKVGYPGYLGSVYGGEDGSAAPRDADYDSLDDFGDSDDEDMAELMKGFVAPSRGPDKKNMARFRGSEKGSRRGSDTNGSDEDEDEDEDGDGDGDDCDRQGNGRRYLGSEPRSKAQTQIPSKNTAGSTVHKSVGKSGLVSSVSQPTVGSAAVRSNVIVKAGQRIKVAPRGRKDWKTNSGVL